MPTVLVLDNRRKLNRVVDSKSWLPLQATDAPFVKDKVVAIETVSGGQTYMWDGVVRAEDNDRYAVYLEMTCRRGDAPIARRRVAAIEEKYVTVTVDSMPASNVLVDLYTE